MDLATNLQMLTAGLAMGCIYILVALGICVIYNAVGVVSFCQGEMVMIPAFVAVALIATTGWSLAVIFPLTLIIAAVLGLIFQRIAYYPIRNRGWLPFVIATIGVSLFLQNGAQITFGAEPQLLARPTSGQVLNVSGVFVDPQYIVIIGVTVVLLILQYLFFEKTSLGKKMQATAQDKDMARLLGIPVATMIALTFILSTVLAAMAGILVGPIFYVSKEMGGMLGLKAFCATIIGGFGSIPGAIIGGLFLGIVEVFASFYISSAYRDAFAFLVLILVMLVRPQGLFGEKVAEKA